VLMFDELPWPGSALEWMKLQTTLGLRAGVGLPICFAFSSDMGLRMRNEKGTQS
jgi:hypothetical protein